MTPQELSLVLASALLHALWSVAIKGSRLPLVFNLLQKPGHLLLLAALLPFVHLGEIPAPVWRLLACTSLIHGLYLYWLSRAFTHGDLTLVYPIARSAPAFLPFVAAVFLGERVSLAGALGIATVLAGMWLVQLGPGVDRASLAGPAARFAYLTLAATVGYSLVDKMGMAALGASPWTSPVPRALAFCVLLDLGSTAVFLPLALRRVGIASVLGAGRRELGLATLAAWLSVLGYALILEALETASVSYVVTVRQTSVLFALVLGVVWLREVPGRRRAVGGVATVVGVALIALGGR